MALLIVFSHPENVVPCSIISPRSQKDTTNVSIVMLWIRTMKICRQPLLLSFLENNVLKDSICKDVCTLKAVSMLAKSQQSL